MEQNEVRCLGAKPIVDGQKHGAAIKARGVGFRVNNKSILQHVEFDGYAGEFVGLLGPNGAGKSTLLRLLAGMHPPTSGSISLFGRDITALTPLQIAQDVAYVPQDTQIAFDFSTREIVLMGRHPHIGRFETESETDFTIVEETMTRVGIAHLAARPVVSLSGGERQMVFIAKALAQQPRVLLLDEPIAALDIRHQLHILSTVRSLTAGGVTVVAVLHDLDLAARFCDRLYLMKAGKIGARGTPTEVYEEQTLGRTYDVRAVVRHDDIVDSPTVTALNGSPRAGADHPSHGNGPFGTARPTKS